MRLDKQTFEKLPERIKESLKLKYPTETRALLSKRETQVISTTKRKFCDGVKFSPWPSNNPAHKLHQQLVRYFGDYFRHEGGNIVHEVMLNNSPKKWRYDHCFVKSRVLIEFTDGKVTIFLKHSKETMKKEPMPLQKASSFTT